MERKSKKKRLGILTFCGTSNREFSGVTQGGAAQMRIATMLPLVKNIYCVICGNDRYIQNKSLASTYFLGGRGKGGELHNKRSWRASAMVRPR